MVLYPKIYTSLEPLTLHNNIFENLSYYVVSYHTCIEASVSILHIGYQYLASPYDQKQIKKLEKNLLLNAFSVKRKLQ